MKNKKDKRNVGQGKILLGIVFSIVVVLLLLSSETKNQRPMSVPISTNTKEISLAQNPQASSSELIQQATSTTQNTATSHDPMAEYLAKQSSKLAAKQAMLSASNTIMAQKVIPQKQDSGKTYSGQDAINFIKTLPLETQKQIMGEKK